VESHSNPAVVIIDLSHCPYYEAGLDRVDISHCLLQEQIGILSVVALSRVDHCKADLDVQLLSNVAEETIFEIIVSDLEEIVLSIVNDSFLDIVGAVGGKRESCEVDGHHNLVPEVLIQVFLAGHQGG
jgi:hypothetical protein